MNTGITDKFIETINRQAVLYNELKDIIKTEAAALEGKDLKAIDQIVKREEAAIDKIKSLEKEKAGFFLKLAEKAGFKEDSGVKIKDVLLKMEGEESAGIEKALAELISAVKEVDVANAANAHFLKNLIEYTEFSKMLRQQIKEPEQTTYDKSGGKKTEKMQDSPRIDKTV